MPAIHSKKMTIFSRILLLAFLFPALALSQTTGDAPSQPPVKKSRSQKNAPSVKVDAATVADGDSAPVLISTTGGRGAGNDHQKWPNFAALQKAADEQNPDALYELGQRYLEGTPDTPKNITRALLNMEDAARRGQRAAHFRLGKLYADGVETPRDYAKALAHYKAAALAGDPIAQHNLGAMISTGRGVKRDYAEGLAWFILAARKNSEAAESEKKLRDFLAKQPATIAAGEKRAAELDIELVRQSAPKPAAPKPDPLKVEVAPITPPPFQPMPIVPLGN